MITPTPELSSTQASTDMTSRAQEVVSEQNQPKPQASDIPPEKKKQWDEFRSRIDQCKSYRRRLVTLWLENIDRRRGKPFASHSDEDRIYVNLDWSLTKTKQASLFSQVPQVRVNHAPATVDLPWLFSYEQKVNDTLISAGIESAMDEELPDVINAAGFGAVLVCYDSITEDKEVPVQDLSLIPDPLTGQPFTPEQIELITQSKMMPDGTPLQMQVVPQTIDRKYSVNRISPADFLWPINFNGSDFDLAPWIGRSGRVSWAEAVQMWKLTPEDKEKVLGEDRSQIDKLTNDVEKDRADADQMVGFDEIFYKEYKYGQARSYSTIHHLVFLTGKTEPVVDEPWKGQRIEGDMVIGSLKFPIRVLTLTYITDEAIPPSDSAIGRPQVNELGKTRTQIIQQRDRNIPMRWMDTNRIDQAIQHSIMRGQWGAVIPVQGNGQNALGEIAKASIPQENFTFDAIFKSDLAEAWSLGPNQVGSGRDVETKGEGDTIEGNYQTRLGRERAKVAKHFCSIAEVIGGLVCLFEDPASFGEGFDPAVSKTLCYSILADSTVLLDSNQRLKRLIDFVDFGAKSGWVSLEPVMKEIASLSGLDPNVVIVPPQPAPPPPPNISLRLTGSEDMMNPLLLAFILASGQGPNPELIEQAKQFISMVVTPAPPPPPPVMETGPDGSTKLAQPQAPEKTAPALEGLQITLAPAVPQTGPDGQPLSAPSGPPPAPGEANPDFNLMPTVGKRETGKNGGTQ